MRKKKGKKVSPQKTIYLLTYFRPISSSAETETGMSRLALSTADKHARDWFVETTRSLGCKVTIDAMGNTFAVRPGKKKNMDAPPTCAGSHLDTQPSGGRYVSRISLIHSVFSAYV